MIANGDVVANSNKVATSTASTASKAPGSETPTGLLIDLSSSSLPVGQPSLLHMNRRSSSSSQRTNSTADSCVTPPSTPFRQRHLIHLPKPPARKLEYCEREHPKNAFKRLNIMRQKGQLCDVSLTVDEREIRAHRIVLAACSPYFEAMFIGEFAEPENIPVVIEEVDEASLVALVEFSYTSRINITQMNVYSLFEAAELLQFPGVRNACFRFFKNQMNKTNCIRTWLFAESHNCTELIEASLKYIECNFLDIARGREFLTVEPETVSQIADLEDLAITCEEQVYEAVVGWLNHDLEVRKQYTMMLLKSVRFPSMSREYLMYIVDHEPLIQNDPDCLQLLIDALQSHMSSMRATLKRKLKKQGSKSLPRAASMAVEVGVQCVCVSVCVWVCEHTMHTIFSTTLVLFVNTTNCSIGGPIKEGVERTAVNTYRYTGNCSLLVCVCVCASSHQCVVSVTTTPPIAMECFLHCTNTVQ